MCVQVKGFGGRLARIGAGLCGLALASCFLLLTCSPLSAQEPPPPEGPAATTWSGQGLKVEVAPLYIEPMTAFFLHRGFPYDLARDFTRAGCVFRGSIGHAGDGPDPIHVDLRQWSLRHDGHWRPYPTKNHWLAKLAGERLEPSALVAFRWALLPVEQEYRPNDYNWGLQVLGLPPGTVFDLRVVWRRGDMRHERVLENLRCTRENDS